MLRPLGKRVSNVGLPAGSLVHVGQVKTDRVRLATAVYDEAEYAEGNSAEGFSAQSPAPGVTWISVIGLHEVDVLEQLGVSYGLHPLLLEDILNTTQRPKIEDMGAYLLVVLKSLSVDPAASNEIDVEQISLVLGKDFVLSFQEQEGDAFDPIRDRIAHSRGRIRALGADYLLHALLDHIVDGYFVVLEWVGEQMEDLEEELVSRPTTETLQALNLLKRRMVLLRKAVWPLREIVNQLARKDSPLIQDETSLYLRDLYDHTIQVIDTIETYRDVASGMLDIYLSSVSNRMNEVMKVLTVISTLFIPLTFLAGVYGMNFRYLPELSWRWGYPLFWVISLTTMVLMMLFFRRRKWL